MSRPNRPRDVKAEQHVARNIEILRVSRGWTYEGLAQRMGTAGCPIDQSAIYKIERLGRRIVVDELVTFARVFERTLDQLVTDPDVADQHALEEVLSKWFELAAQQVLLLEEQAQDRARLGERIRSVLKAHPDARSMVDFYSNTDASNGQPGSWLAAELKNWRSASSGKRRTKA